MYIFSLGIVHGLESTIYISEPRSVFVFRPKESTSTVWDLLDIIIRARLDVSSGKRKC
jgi:hypothetical protein